jgi:hypothetical protein
MMVGALKINSKKAYTNKPWNPFHPYSFDEISLLVWSGF